MYFKSHRQIPRRVSQDDALAYYPHFILLISAVHRMRFDLDSRAVCDHDITICGSIVVWDFKPCLKFLANRGHSGYLRTSSVVLGGGFIDIIYYFVIWTDNGSMLPEANTWRQEGKYPRIKVLQGCILKLLLHSVNSVPILYRAGKMQSAILLSFLTSSSLPPCALQSTYPRMPCYMSP